MKNFKSPPPQNLGVKNSLYRGGSARRRLMMYNDNTIKNGLYIQDISGKLWLPDEYDNSVKMNGYAIIDDQCSFVVASKELSGTYAMTPDSSVYVFPLKEYTQYDANNDYLGRSNTKKIINFLGEDFYSAAHACNDYVFPNGQKGYLASCGEWYIALKHGLKVRYVRHWTSTYTGWGGGGSMFATIINSTSSINYSFAADEWVLVPFTELII